MPMALNPSLKEPSFAFAASVAMSVSLTCPVNAPNTAVSFESFPSAIAAAIGSLKGPKHGGANIKVSQMFADIKKNVADWKDDEEIAAYLNKILNKECFDKSGLIYGIGHAVYSLSDPRALLLKKSTKNLSVEKDWIKISNSTPKSKKSLSNYFRPTPYLQRRKR